MVTRTDTAIQDRVHQQLRSGELSQRVAEDLRTSAIKVSQVVTAGVYATAEQRNEAIGRLNHVRAAARKSIGDLAEVPEVCGSWFDARLSGAELEFVAALRSGEDIEPERKPELPPVPSLIPEKPKLTPAAATSPAVTAPAVAPAAAAPEKPKAITPIPPVVKDQNSDSITAAWSADRVSTLTADEKERFRGGVRQAIQAGRLNKHQARDYIKYFEKGRGAAGLCYEAGRDLWTKCCRSENGDKLREEATSVCIDELKKVVESFEKTSV
jgi:hypothetical protein